LVTQFREHDNIIIVRNININKNNYLDICIIIQKINKKEKEEKIFYIYFLKDCDIYNYGTFQDGIILNTSKMENKKYDPFNDRKNTAKLQIPIKKIIDNEIKKISFI